MSDKVSEWVRTTTESCCCVLWKKHFCIVYTVNTPPLYIYTVYITITAKSLNVPPFPIWYTRRNSLAILKKYSRADVISFLKHGVYKTAYFIVETKKENESIFINIYTKIPIKTSTENTSVECIHVLTENMGSGSIWHELRGKGKCRHCSSARWWVEGHATLSKEEIAGPIMRF